ncbi:MAG: MBL fold metallo-hydrolase [Desulfobulbaceae bacterium]|nr:MBL fold metallo-hydrolase [Desulfobulbaceae bacterium]
MRIQQVTVGSMGVCCYIVSCEKTKKAAVIDPGGDEARLLSLIKEDGLDLQYIIATHSHPDHVCGNEKIKQETGAAIIMHTAEGDFFAKPDVQNYFSMLGLPHSPTPDQLVNEGDNISFGEVSLQVIHTPGHTPGGMCLYSEPHCFTGDTLFVNGIGRTDFPGGSFDELMESIRTKLLTLPAETVVWPGHGYGGSQSTIGTEAKGNMYL